MKRSYAFGTLLALVLVLSITATALAAGPGPNAEAMAQPGTAGQGAALNGTFVDVAPADGVRDNYVERTPVLDGSGNQWGGGQATPGANFIDEDGDGVCDTCLGSGVPAQDGSGYQQAPKGRWNR